jgi:hypothetical protein
VCDVTVGRTKRPSRGEGITLAYNGTLFVLQPKESRLVAGLVEIHQSEQTCYRHEPSANPCDAINWMPWVGEVKGMVGL